MAEDRKPKIDLKSRLQKMGGPAATPGPVAPPGMGSVPAPAMTPPPGGVRGGPGLTPVPPPPSAPPGMPRAPAMQHAAPPGMMHPGHAASPMAPAMMPAAQARQALPQAQVIEVDEGAVQQARSGGFKKGLIAGIVVAAGLAALGWVGGIAKANADAHSKGVSDAHDLSGDLGKAKESLGQLAQKLQDGQKTLGDRKFPSDLAQQLAGLNVDFGGDKLFGRRFSGVPADTTRQLFDFITRVQTLNDKKDLVIALLNKLQKPLTEELSRPAGVPLISYVVVVDKDTYGPGSGAFLAPLTAPVSAEGLAGDLTFINPRSSGNVKLPRLQNEKIPKDGAAIAVIPSSFDKVCPSLTRGQIGQLGSSMNSLLQDINGQKAAEGGDAVTETKPGLADTAGTLADQLGKVN